MTKHLVPLFLSLCSFASGGCGMLLGIDTDDIDADDIDAAAIDADVDTNGPSGLVARYYIDEADSGTEPALLVDDATPQVNLNIDYKEMLHFVEIDGQRGISWPVGHQRDKVYADLAGTKIIDMLDGSTAATVELVVQIDDLLSYDERLFELTSTTEGHSLTLSIFSDDGLSLSCGGLANGCRWDYPINQQRPLIIHAVVDNEAEASEQRARLYIDGTLIGADASNSEFPELGQPLVVPPDSRLTLGSNANGERNIAGTLFYAAVYHSALSDTEILQQYELLSANNDRPR